MDDKFTADEKALISALVSNRLTYLYREIQRYSKSDFNNEHLKDIVEADKERVDMCISIINKLRNCKN